MRAGDFLDRPQFGCADAVAVRVGFLFGKFVAKFQREFGRRATASRFWAVVLPSLVISPHFGAWAAVLVGVSHVALFLSALSGRLNDC